MGRLRSIVVILSLVSTGAVALETESASATVPCTIYWTNTHGWNDPNGWAADSAGTAPAGHIPAATDYVCLASSVTATLIILDNYSTTIAGIDLEVANGGLSLYDNSTLTIGSSAGAYDSVISRLSLGSLDGRTSHATLAGTANVALEGFGDLGGTVDTTTLSGSGNLTIAPDAQYFFGSNKLSLEDGRHLVNDGVLSGEFSQNPQTVELDATAGIENHGQMTLTSTAGVMRGDTGATFVNASDGSLDYQGYDDGPGSYKISLPLANAGAVSVAFGRFVLPRIENYANGVLTGGTWIATFGWSTAPSVLVLPGVVRTNAAAIQVEPDGLLQTADGDDALATLQTNNGSLTVDRNTTLPGTLINYGTVKVGATLQVRAYVQKAGTTITTATGTLSSGPGGGKPVRLVGGELSGRGIVHGPVIRGGDIHPDATTTGSLTIDSWDATYASTLDVDVAPQAGGVLRSALSVSGSAALDGTLDISTTNGYRPSVGSTITILKGASVTGTFRHIVGRHVTNSTYWQPTYTPIAVTLTVVAAPRLSIHSLSISEGDADSTVAIVPVTLDAPSELPVTVDYATADGSATAGADYVAVTGTLTIPPGWTSGAIRVPVLGDTDVEPDETFTVTLSNPADVRLVVASATVTIRNDDPAGSVPTVLGVDPNIVGQNATGRMITLTGTGFIEGDSVDFGTPDVSATDISVIDPTHLAVTISTTATAPLGLTDVLVHAPLGGTGVCNACLDVTAAPQVHLASRLGQGVQDRDITITGTGLTDGSLVLVAGGVIAGPLRLQADGSALVAVTVPASVEAARYDVTVLAPDGGTSSCAGCLRVERGPRVTSLAPATAARGDAVVVTIEGSGFSRDATITGPAGVRFDTVTVVDATTITARMVVTTAADAGAHRTIHITNGATGYWGSAGFTGLTIT